MKNPKEKIIELMRGYYALPIIAFLGRTGVLDRWLEESYQETKEFVGQNQKRMDILRYLSSLDLINFLEIEERFEITSLARKVFSRHGAFNIIHSYKDYFEHLDQLLDDNGESFCVDRDENVYGSGQIHNKKFFCDGIDLLPNELEIHIDIACGDGTFLEKMKSKFKTLSASYGVDLSIDAIKLTEKRINNQKLKNVFLFQGDGFKVEKWVDTLKIDPKKIGVISFWFFIHEVSSKNPEKIIDLLKKIHLMLPNCYLLICENVLVDHEDLKDFNHQSAVPEFTLFHEFSDQGMMTWQQYQKIFSEIPYETDKEILYDQIGHNQIPSSFIRLLRPNKL